MTLRLLMDYHMEFLSLKGGRTGSSESLDLLSHRLFWVYTWQNATLLESTSRGSFFVDNPQFWRERDPGLVFVINDSPSNWHQLNSPFLRGSSRFGHRGSNSDKFFPQLIDEGENKRWRFAGVQMMAQHWMRAWQLCDFPGDRDQYC